MIGHQKQSARAPYKVGNFNWQCKGFTMSARLHLDHLDQCNSHQDVQLNMLVLPHWHPPQCGTIVAAIEYSGKGCVHVSGFRVDADSCGEKPACVKVMC